MNLRTVVIALAVIVLTALAASGCGESDEVKAQERVCDARAGIASEVESLGGLTPSTITADAVRDSVDSIKGDLKEVGDARDDVSDERRDELEDANTAFTASIREIGANALRSQSVDEAQTQLTAAVDTVAASYRSTLGAYDCG
jgi:cell division septation protein DedD